MYGNRSVIFLNDNAVLADDAVLAECERLLRRTLDLVDEYRISRVIAARLAHLIHDVSHERQIGELAMGKQ